MNRQVSSVNYLDDKYHGAILLSSDYSDGLKRRLEDCIQGYRAYEKTKTAAMLYIAAWKSDEEKIWYEYTGKKFVELFGCDHNQIADKFRESVVDRRIYKSVGLEATFEKEIISHAELSIAWKRLREEGKQAGTIDAVYKLNLEGRETTWLKDQATIEVYEEDDVCLSLGFLTIVSKEMEAEDALKQHHDLLETRIAERTSELQALNKQLQKEIDERQLTQEKLNDSNLLLQKSLDEVIAAMSLTLEERDPYTAGHQRRTTELALAIAREMGLSEHRAKGLQMAGLIHDMGKISVPAEILNKPGPLNDVELLLIRRHPQVAYEILQQINFPWLVDKIVLQHHERIDGSGYPAGLSGDDILLESKILSVADVVETMETHRPYRPSLGREAALEEISKNRGLLYDSDVVGACIELFGSNTFEYCTNTPQPKRNVNYPLSGEYINL